MKVTINIRMRKTVLDPQGKAVHMGLGSLGFKQVKDVRVGKLIDVEVDCSTKKEAEVIVKEMCEKLLVNMVIEDYDFKIDGG